MMDFLRGKQRSPEGLSHDMSMFFDAHTVHADRSVALSRCTPVADDANRNRRSQTLASQDPAIVPIAKALGLLFAGTSLDGAWGHRAVALIVVETEPPGNERLPTTSYRTFSGLWHRSSLASRGHQE